MSASLIVCLSYSLIVCLYFSLSYSLIVRLSHSLSYSLIVRLSHSLSYSHIVRLSSCLCVFLFICGIVFFFLPIVFLRFSSQLWCLYFFWFCYSHFIVKTVADRRWQNRMSRFLCFRNSFPEISKIYILGSFDKTLWSSFKHTKKSLFGRFLRKKSFLLTREISNCVYWRDFKFAFSC